MTNNIDSMAKFEIGERTVILTATSNGYLVQTQTAPNCWVFKSFGMKVLDYRKAIDFFSETVRQWLNEYM